MNPKAFISYSWESEEHKERVKDLATELRKDGVDVILDVWETAPGSKLPEFMETAIRESSYCIVICTPKYKEKSDHRKGGVGFEGHIMTAEVLNGQREEKFIPVIFTGDVSDAIPTWLSGACYLDFRGKYPKDYDEILDTLLGRREKAPPVGSPPPIENNMTRSSTMVDRGLKGKMSQSDLMILVDEVIVSGNKIDLKQLAEQFDVDVGDVRQALYGLQSKGCLTIEAIGDRYAQVRRISRLLR